MTVTAATPALRATREPGTGRLRREGHSAAAQRPQLRHAGFARPGVAVPPGQPFPRINGGRPRTNEYLFDGISVLQPEPGQVAFFPVIDAIQEFKVETNSPPAEFGRFNGGVDQPDDQGGDERAAWHGLRVLPERVAERAQLLRRPPMRPSPRSAAISSAASSAGRWCAIARSSSWTIRASGRTSNAPCISTVPTMAQRQGVFTQNIVTIRRSTIRPTAAGGVHAHAVPGQHDSHRPHGSGGAGTAAALSASRRRRARPTTTVAPPVRSTIRTSGMCAIDHQFASDT